MKGIIIPVLLLAGAVVFVIMSGVSADTSISELIRLTEALPEEPAENTLNELEKIENEWNNHKELYSAVIKFDFVYNFSKEINAAKAGVGAEDPGTYLAAKKSMINILEYIRDVQKLRLDNII